MFRHIIRPAVLVTLVLVIVFQLPQLVDAQVGTPQRDRIRIERPNKFRQGRQPPPPSPKTEGILKLLVPPEQKAKAGDRAGDRSKKAGDRGRPKQPRVPKKSKVARMKPKQQRALLRKAVQSLDEELARAKKGANLKKYLQLEALGSGLWTGKSASPDKQTRDSLNAIADRFDAAAKKPRFKTIHKMWGFKVVRVALREYAIDPVQLSKRQVRKNSGLLSKSLGEVTAEPGWKKYLKINEVNRLAKAKKKMTPDDQKTLKKIIKQFNEVRKNPEYRSVSGMKGFRATHSGLQQLQKDMAQTVKKKPSHGMGPDNVIKVAMREYKHVTLPEKLTVVRGGGEEKSKGLMAPGSLKMKAPPLLTNQQKFTLLGSGRLSFKPSGKPFTLTAANPILPGEAYLMFYNTKIVSPESPYKSPDAPSSGGGRGPIAIIGSQSSSPTSVTSNRMVRLIMTGKPKGTRYLIDFRVDGGDTYYVNVLGGGPQLAFNRTNHLILVYEPVENTEGRIAVSANVDESRSKLPWYFYSCEVTPLK